MCWMLVLIGCVKWESQSQALYGTGVKFVQIKLPNGTVLKSTLWPCGVCQPMSSSQGQFTGWQTPYACDSFGVVIQGLCIKNLQILWIRYYNYICRCTISWIEFSRHIILTKLCHIFQGLSTLLSTQIQTSSIIALPYFLIWALCGWGQGSQYFDSDWLGLGELMPGHHCIFMILSQLPWHCSLLIYMI